MEPLCKPLNDLTREHAFGSGEARVPDHNAIRSVFSQRRSRDRAHRCSPQKYGGYNGRCIKVIKPRDLWPLLSRLCFCCLWTLSKIQQVPPRCGDKARHDDVGPKREKLCLGTERLLSLFLARGSSLEEGEFLFFYIPKCESLITIS